MGFRQRCAPANNYSAPHAMPQAEAADPDKIRGYISADAEYMEKSFKQLVAGIEQRAGVRLEDARANSVEARRQNLKSRLEGLQTQYFNTMNEFHIERNRLVEQIHALKSYVEFQLQQQKDMQAERTSDSTLPTDIEGIERDASGRQIWIPLQANETLSFNYVTNNPQVSRLLGRITFEPNSISSRMPGTYTMQRATHNGKSYVVLSPDASFSGTFTVMIGNRRSLVEVGTEAEMKLAKDRRNRGNAGSGTDNPPRNSDTPPEESKLPNRTFEPSRTIDWSLPENYAAYQSLQARILAKTNQLAAVLGLSNADPLNEGLGHQVEVFTAELKILNDLKATITPPAEPSASTETRPDISRFITSAREKAIYAWLRNQPNKTPMWYGTDVPNGKAGCEYMVGPDGHLFARYTSGAAVTQRFVFENEKWKEFPRN